MKSLDLIKKSKYLSLVLRHDPGKINIVLDENGWAQTSDLIKALGWKMSDLEEVVENNDKKRFEFDQYKKRIRASQGHSVEVDLGYKEREPPEFLYHGTSRDNYESIRKQGLLKMDRHDVHLFDDKARALDIANKRRRNPGVLTIKAKAMVADGYKFKLSTNNVWLTEIVPTGYLDIHICGATDGTSDCALRHYCTLPPNHGGTNHEHSHPLGEPGCAHSSWPVSRTSRDG
jgi:putative RNA 2'-phosphotransferase